MLAISLAAYAMHSVQGADRLAPDLPEKWINDDAGENPVDRYVIATKPRSISTAADFARRERVRLSGSTAETSGTTQTSLWSAATAWPWLWHCVAVGGIAVIGGGLLVWRRASRRDDLPDVAVLAMSAAPARPRVRPAMAVPEKRKAA